MYFVELRCPRAVNTSYLEINDDDDGHQALSLVVIEINNKKKLNFLKLDKNF